MMRLAVFIKQVPAAGEGRTDPELGLLIRGLRRRLNPYDGPALEAALRLRESLGGSVEVFSMGPAGAREVLAEALAMGADQAWLLSDPALAGADSLATDGPWPPGPGPGGPLTCISAASPPPMAIPARSAPPWPPFWACPLSAG